MWLYRNLRTPKKTNAANSAFWSWNPLSGKIQKLGMLPNALIMLQAIVFASLPFSLYIREALEPSWKVHNTGSESRLEWIVGVGERMSRAEGCPCFQGWGRSHRGSRGRATSVGGGRGYVGQQGRHRGRGQPVLFTSSRIYVFISRQISTYGVTTIAPTKVPKQNINDIYI